MATILNHSPIFEKKMKAIVLKRLPRYGELTSLTRYQGEWPRVEFTIRPTKRMLAELRQLYAAERQR